MKEFIVKLLKRGNSICLFVVAFSIAAEIFAACGNIFITVFLDLFILLFLLILAFYKHNETADPLYLALAPIPLIRIISAAMPLTGISEISGFAVVGVPLFIAGIMVAKMIGLTPNEMGLRLNKPLKQLLLALAGLPLGFVEYLIAKPGMEDAPGTPGNIIIWVLIIILFTGLLEEFLYRGILFHVLLRLQGKKSAILFTSLLYAAMTISGKSFLNTICVFLISVLFCRIFVCFKSLSGLSLAHGLINITLYIICPYIFGLLGK